MNDTVNKASIHTGRRQFLKATALVGGGLVIGSLLPRGSRAAAGDGAMDFGPFIRITPDNMVTVISKHLDKGQGVTTGLCTIVAEELDAAWEQMQVVFAPADAQRYANLLFGVQGTGGSTSMANSWEQLRKSAAAARHMLIEAAASRLNVPAESLQTKDGYVIADGSRLGFGELASAAADIAPPAEVKLKSADEFKLVGKQRLPRLDSVAKTNGSPVFTMDLDRPGQWIAVVKRPPRFGAKVQSYNADKARSTPGVHAVVEIPRGIAVLADSYLTAG